MPTFEDCIETAGSSFAFEKAATYGRIVGGLQPYNLLEVRPEPAWVSEAWHTSGLVLPVREARPATDAEDARNLELSAHLATEVSVLAADAIDALYHRGEEDAARFWFDQPEAWMGRILFQKAEGMYFPYGVQFCGQRL